MRIQEIINEGLSHPIIVVDVQPEYANFGNNAKICERIIKFVNKSTGPVLMYVNAEDQGFTADTVDDIKQYWGNVICPEDEREFYDEENDEYVENSDCPSINWNRFKIIDKGYGYLRSWHDQEIDDAKTIKAIRLMYQQNVSDSRELFGGEDSDEYEAGMRELLGDDYLVGMDDSIFVKWTSVKQLKQFSGAYLVGGGRNECLWEIRILMNAFNIRAKLVDSLIYG